MRDDDHKLAPGKLNDLQRLPYPKGDTPLDPRLIWFLFRFRGALMSICTIIERIIEEENKHASNH